jgi:hypothetical protein
MDAADEAGPILDAPRDPGGYPLADNVGSLCFDPAQFPTAKSIEERFSLALEQHDYSPLKKLADRLRWADYHIAYPLASAEKSNCYREFFQTFVGSAFLTFNYDSLPETVLSRLECWYPHDGYGVPVRVYLPQVKSEMIRRRSASIVLHLHGTLCIRTEEFEWRRTPPGPMAWIAERDHPAYLFDPSSISRNFAPFQRVVGFDHIEDRIIAPIPDKAEGLKQAFIRETYQKAVELVCGSETDVVAIGYSFGVHDRASYQPVLQASSESRNRRLLIVSREAHSISERLKLEFPHIFIEPVEATFKRWASHSFPGLGVCNDKTAGVSSN